MSPRLLLGLAAAAVGALIIGLWIMIHPSSSDASPERPAVAKAEDPKPAPVTEAPVAAPTRAARPAAITPAPRPAPAPAPTPAPSAPPAAPEKTEAEIKAGDMQRLLKTGIIATEQQMIDCVDRAGKGAAKLEGEIAFPFTVSRKGGKIVVDSGTVDYSSLGDPRVTECMTGVTKAMAYTELPDDIASVTSYRKITVKDGAVVQDWLGPHTTVPAKPAQ